MGKYSLDAFETYPLVKLRPVMTAPEESCFRLLELSQSELEPEAGTLLQPPPVGEGRVILRLRLDGGEDIAEACGFVRRMGFCYAGGRDLAGVVLVTEPFAGVAADQLLGAYAQGFGATFLLAEPGRQQTEACRRLGVNFGLWLPLERGVLSLRRSIGQENLARVWEKWPVYLYAGRELTAQEQDAACRWHISGADMPLKAGPGMTLRRMMFPRDLTAGGVMPLRMWWQNLGTAPIYRDVQVRLELRKEGECYPLTLADARLLSGMGDSTLNTTAALPRVQGDFELRCGLYQGETMLPLAMEAPFDGGMYTIGSVSLDGEPRPYLSTMWEETYADGYYPLEDPAQPE